MLEVIKNNFQKLMALYEGERQKNSELSSTLEQSRRECEDLRQKISDLKKQIENQKLTDAFLGGSSGVADAREKIGKLIHEIDKCIATLES